MQVISKGELVSILDHIDHLDKCIPHVPHDGPADQLDHMIEMLQIKLKNYDRIDQAHEDDKLDAEE